MATKRLTIDQHREGVCHIEAPGCIVNIYHGLTDTEGRPVTRVNILPDQYAGEPAWRLPDFVTPEPTEEQIAYFHSLLPFDREESTRLLQKLLGLGARDQHLGVRVRRDHQWLMKSLEGPDPEDGPLYWSNDDGWVDRASATRFSQAEREDPAMALVGRWAWEVA